MRRSGSTAFTVATVAVLLAGCGQDHTKAPSRTPEAKLSAAASAAAATASASAPASSSASADAVPVVSAAWTTGPVTVVHTPTVPPVPVILRVRYAGHPEDGYDRFVLDLADGLPGYSAKYVPQVRADGSDKPVAVPGRAFLLIVLTPAQAHTGTGAATVTGVHPLTLPMIKGWAVAGDFEGHVSIALGLAAKTGYRIGELPGRIYIDVKT